MDEKIFELSGVHYAYLGKYPALSGIDLSIRKGSRVALIGANGAGKSTLLQMLDALIFPDRGTVRAFGRDLTESAFEDGAFSREFRKRVGFVFQNPDIQLFCPVVREDIAFGPLQLGVPQDVIRKRMGELEGLLDLAGLMDRAPHQLSVGEKRKVAIASTLAVDPEVLLLDEPTAGLDPLTTRQILDILRRENGRGKTVVTATHDLHLVEEIADEVWVFDRRKGIARHGAPAEILADLDFLEQHNLLHAHGHRHGGSPGHAHVHSPLNHHGPSA